MPRQKSTHVDDPKAVGERLKRARVAAGMSQRQLAFPGCSPAYISRVESGDRIPSLQILRELGRPVDTLRPPAGEVATWRDGDLTWIRARPEWVFPIEFEQLPAAADVDAIQGARADRDSWYPWAWIDEPRGLLRSRYFVRELGIDEDQATGAAAVALGARLRRPLEIHQGRGSRLFVRPGPDGTVEVGGRCAGLEERSYDVEAMPGHG